MSLSKVRHYFRIRVAGLPSYTLRTYLRLRISTQSAQNAC